MIIDCGLYRDGHRIGGRLTIDEAHGHRIDDDAFVWVTLDRPSPEQIDEVERTFQLPAGSMGRISVEHDRSRLHRPVGDVVALVMRTARYDESSETVHFGQVGLLVNHNVVVEVHSGDGAKIVTSRSTIGPTPNDFRHGPPGVLAAITSAVLDSYHPVLEGIANDIDEVEAQVFDATTTSPTERIYSLNSEVLELRRAVGPLRDAVNRLADGARGILEPADAAKFFELTDDATRVAEQVDNHRALLDSALAANLTQVSIRQNEDMRKMSAWAAILAVPTAIAGIYGMNFRNMPELESRWGYPIVLAIIALICVALHRQFKRVGWL